MTRNATTERDLLLRGAQIATQIGAVKLERMGMRRSRGNITPRLKEVYGLPRRASYDEVLNALHKEKKEINDQLTKMGYTL